MNMCRTMLTKFHMYGNDLMNMTTQVITTYMPSVFHIFNYFERSTRDYKMLEAL